jgi:hypothetical protein
VPIAELLFLLLLMSTLLLLHTASGCSEMRINGSSSPW